MRIFGKIADGAKKAFHKIAGGYAKAKSFGKNALEHAQSRYPSLFHAGLEAIYNSPLGDKVEGARQIMNQIDNLAMGDSTKKLQAIASLGRMALKRDLSSVAQGLGEEGMRYLETGARRSGMEGVLGALQPALQSQIMRGVRKIRELESPAEGMA
jgi:hypothetical protein